MTYKICQVIFSTNRIQYLSKTLNAQRHLNFDGCTVDKIFIDDYPNGRNNSLITALVNTFGYKELYLHETNLGLSVTWTEFWKLIKDRGYDYVWHQEDDVEILETVNVLDLIQILEQNKQWSQVVLKRQPWYFYDTAPVALDTDIIFKNLRIDSAGFLFSPMASLYSIDIVNFPYSEWYKEAYPDSNLHTINFNEGMVGKALVESKGLMSVQIKNELGHNIINHIGDYFVGKRVLPDEPCYEQFAKYDPNKKYNSKDGSEYTD